MVKADIKTVTFEVDDALAVSAKLRTLAIDHHWTSRTDRTRPVITAYYDSSESAERLLKFLVGRAPVKDKITWQQREAHREIGGWCELCEMANRGECDGGCLTQVRAETLFVRIAKILEPDHSY
jgi:hypothetical protein